MSSLAVKHCLNRIKDVKGDLLKKLKQDEKGGIWELETSQGKALGEKNEGFISSLPPPLSFLMDKEDMWH